MRILEFDDDDDGEYYDQDDNGDDDDDHGEYYDIDEELCGEWEGRDEQDLEVGETTTNQRYQHNTKSMTSEMSEA